MKILLVLGLLLFFYCLFLISNLKKQFPNDILIEYEKEFKPRFLKVYYFSLMPFLFFIILFISDKLDLILIYKEIVLGSVILIDSIAIVIVISLFSSGNISNELKMIKNPFLGMMFGKLMTLVAILLFLFSN